MTLEKGQMIYVDSDAMLDTDAIDWFIDEDIGNGIVMVESFDDDHVWVVGCPYAIQLEYVEEIVR